MPKKVIVDVASDGTVKIEVEGVVGPSCQTITDALLESVGGDVVSDDKKPEFYEQESEEVSAGGW